MILNSLRIFIYSYTKFQHKSYRVNSIKPTRLQLMKNKFTYSTQRTIQTSMKFPKQNESKPLCIINPSPSSTKPNGIIFKNHQAIRVQPTTMGSQRKNQREGARTRARQTIIISLARALSRSVAANSGNNNNSGAGEAATFVPYLSVDARQYHRVH